MQPTRKRRVRRAMTLAGVGAGAGALLRRNRRERLRAAVRGIHDTVLPEDTAAVGRVDPVLGPEGHAPGHQHLGPGTDEQPADRGAHEHGAPWSESPAHWGSVHHRERG